MVGSRSADPFFWGEGEETNVRSLLIAANDPFFAETASLHLLSPQLENRLTSNRGHFRGAGQQLHFVQSLTAALSVFACNCRSSASKNISLTHDHRGLPGEPRYLRPAGATLADGMALELVLGDPGRHLVGHADHRMPAIPTSNLDVGNAGGEQFIEGAGHPDGVAEQHFGIDSIS